MKSKKELICTIGAPVLTIAQWIGVTLCTIGIFALGFDAVMLFVYVCYLIGHVINSSPSAALWGNRIGVALSIIVWSGIILVGGYFAVLNIAAEFKKRMVRNHARCREFWALDKTE